jgi:hypothetical protein
VPEQSNLKQKLREETPIPLFKFIGEVTSVATARCCRGGYCGILSSRGKAFLRPCCWIIRCYGNGCFASRRGLGRWGSPSVSVSEAVTIGFGLVVLIAEDSILSRN